MSYFLRHLLLPHHTNNFRAKVLHTDFIALYIVVFFIFVLSMRILHRFNPDILGFATDIRIEKLLELTNKKREESGLNMLKLNSQLSQAATQKANYMFLHNFWAHTAPDGTTPWVFINESGYVYALAGENLAKNFSNSDGVTEAWMNSPSHRENILREQYEDIGFAVVNGKLNGEETTLVVQMFGKRLQDSVSIVNLESSTVSAVVKTKSNPEIKINNTVLPQIGSPLNNNVVLTESASSVIRKPIIDIFDTTKKALLGITTGLILALVVDGIYIWRRKIIRISGRNLAHLLFLFAVTELIWFLSIGKII